MYNSLLKWSMCYFKRLMSCPGLACFESNLFDFMNFSGESVCGLPDIIYIPCH